MSTVGSSIDVWFDPKSPGNATLSDLANDRRSMRIVGSIVLGLCVLSLIINKVLYHNKWYRRLEGASGIFDAARGLSDW